MPESWRLIRSGPLTGDWNMALDEALFEAVAAGDSAPVLRLYRWQPPTVTLGYAQSGAQVVNLETCRRLGFAVVRRPTGGRAVLHHQEVTYAVAAPETGGRFQGGILDNYRVIAEVLRQTLLSLGLNVRLAPGRAKTPGAEPGARSACFTAPSSFELVVDGRKIAGSAQKRSRGAFLQHGSIPVNLDPAALFAALDTRGRLSPEAGGRLLAQSVGWINRWLEAPVTVAAVEERLAATFARVLGVELVEQPPSAEEWRRANDLRELKYGNPAWIFKGIS